MEETKLTGEKCWEFVENMRCKRPLIQCITNYMSMNVMANSLLAVGASPAMVHAKEEVADFARISSGMLINIGTLSEAWVTSMEKGAQEACSIPIPWVLDPVGCGATWYRTETSLKLMNLKPTVVRGNPSELMALAKAAGITTTTSAGMILYIANNS